MTDCYAFLKKQPVQQRALDSVARILAASRNLLAQEGYDALTTNRIARESGVNVASIYQYFPDKESILCTLYLQWVAPVYAIYEDSLKLAHDGLPFLAMARQFERRQQQLEENIWGYRHLGHLVEMVPVLRELEQTHVNRSGEYLADLLSAYRSGWPRERLLTYCRMLYLTISTFDSARMCEAPAQQALVLRIYRRTLIAMLRMFLCARHTRPVLPAAADAGAGLSLSLPGDKENA